MNLKCIPQIKNVYTNIFTRNILANFPIAGTMSFLRDQETYHFSCQESIWADTLLHQPLTERIFAIGDWQA